MQEMRPHLLTKNFREKLVKFEQNLGKIKMKFGQNCVKIWAKVIRFGQNQNLASPKAFDLLQLCLKTN